MREHVWAGTTVRMKWWEKIIVHRFCLGHVTWIYKLVRRHALGERDKG